MILNSGFPRVILKVVTDFEMLNEAQVYLVMYQE